MDITEAQPIPNPEDSETLSNAAEVALVVKDLSYLIADSGWGGKDNGKMELVYLYPLHKPQILEFTQHAQSKDFRSFYGDVLMDDDFRAALTTYAEQVVNNATHEDDIINIRAVIGRITSFDYEKALDLATRLQEKVAKGELVGRKAEGFAQFTLDAVAEGTDYIANLQNDELVEIIEGNKFADAKENAFSELLKRNHPFALNLVSQSPAELVSNNVGYQILRQIFAQKLLRGDFNSWAQSFSIDDSTAKQARFSISKACDIGVIDSNNPELVNSIMNFDNDDFFNTIKDFIRANLPLDQRLDQEAMVRLTQILSDIEALDNEDTRELVQPDMYIQYLCQHRPDIAQQLWNTGIPTIKQYTEEYGDTFYGSFFIRSFARGFAPLILQDMSKLDTLSSESITADKLWNEVRSVLFWQMILIEPEKGQELIDQYFSGGYKAKLNGMDGLVAALSLNFSQDEQKALSTQPQVNEFFRQLLAGRMIKGTVHVASQLRHLVQEDGVSELAATQQENLDELAYTIDEAYFINYFMPDIVRGDQEGVSNKLKRFREIQDQCSLENGQKATRFQYDAEKEQAFWNESQIWIASLMDVSPKILEKIIDGNMGHPHGYFKLQENLKVYARIAYTTQSEKFLESFYSVSQSIAPKKLWDFIASNYELEEIANLSDQEMQRVKDFLISVGNLNLGKFYEAYRSILDGTIPPDASELGVTETGRKGADELKTQLYSTIDTLLTDPNFQVNPSNLLHMEIVREVSRFEVSEWRKGKALETIVNKIMHAQESGLLEVQDGYELKEVSVQKNEVDDSEFEYTDESIARFKELQADILWATDDNNSDDELVIQSKEALERVISDQLGRIERAIEQNPELDTRTMKQVVSLRSQLTEIQNINSPDDLLQQTIELKSNFRRDKTIDRILRRTILSQFFSSNKHLQGDLREAGEAVPTYQNMVRVAEIAEHTIGKEFIKRRFPDRDLSRTLLSAFDVKGITTELERYRSFTEYTGQQKLLFVPNRKILGELSGYIADACWTAQNDVMAQNQNITPIIIVTNPDQKGSMRAGGAFLLVEATEPRTGEKVIIVRGNNPQETVIGKLDSTEFVKEVVQYASEVAERRGIARVVVPMDGKGQSATNRQAVFDSYSALYGNNQRVTLSGNISFNGYDLTNRCVAVN